MRCFRSIVFFGLVGMAVAGCGQSDSWKWGYNQAGAADKYVSGGLSPELACRGEAKLAMEYADSRALANPSGAPADLDDAVKGCLAGLKDMGR